MITKTLTTIFIISSFFFKAQEVISQKSDTLPTKTRGLNIKNSVESHSLSMFKFPTSNIAYFVNNKHYNYLFFQSLDTNKIENVNIANKDMTIDGKSFTGAMYLTTKNNYQPQPLDLKEIKKKYAKDQSLPSLYLFNGLLIQDLERNYSLDNNNILEISSHIYENKEENLKVNIIEIFTKSEENIRKSKEVILR
ncbi:hypothetical protein SAMN05421846_112121 [Chryseobacterium taeanense]|uniref:Uncharacterized protein n=1 Tax=Chryseobacterium taeanense TaxID=311334 RepID=A0A1G8MY02_9FLAO|nr:hypothetical protein [Chryseobacterium taeanense]SDI72919.1 hypothetical protein SAMN05421846_112121 [Chryseobacterium taeanense]